MILSSVLLLRRYLETSHLKIPMIFLDELSGSWQIHSTLVMRNFFSRRISLISIVHLEFNRWLPFPSCLSSTTNNPIYKWNYFLSWSFYSTVNLITKKKCIQRKSSSSSRQKDVLNAREKKMFMTFKHHLQSNVCVKQVSFNSRFFLSFLQSSLPFRKVCTNHFSQKLLTEHEWQFFFDIFIPYSRNFLLFISIWINNEWNECWFEDRKKKPLTVIV